MLQGRFDPRKRSLRLEQGSKFYCLWVLFLVRIIYFYEFKQQSKANTLPERHSKFNVRDTHHPVNNFLPHLEDAHKLQI